MSAAESASAAAAASSSAAPTIEDIELPKAVVARIIKDALPEGTGISKDVKTAVLIAARTFIVYATAMANDIALGNNKKTVTGQDVVDAMDELEFPQFKEPLEQLLNQFRSEQREKNDARKNAQEVQRVTDSVVASITKSLQAGKGSVATGAIAEEAGHDGDAMEEDDEEEADEAVQVDAEDDSEDDNGNNGADAGVEDEETMGTS